MAALPKRKISKGRRNRRRSQDKLKKLNLVICPNCKHLKKQHEVCPNCGKYKGESIIKV